MTERKSRLPLLIALLGVVLVVVVVLRITSERAPEAASGGASESVREHEPPAAATAGARPVETEAPASAASGRSEVAPIAKPSLSFERALSGLVGRVVEPEGAPAKDAPVELIGGLIDIASLDFERALFEPESFTLPLQILKTKTDADGRFHFERVDPRGYFVLGVNLGHPRPQLRLVDKLPLAGETVDLGDLALDPPLELKGRVVDERSRPVAGARVRATNLPSIVFQFGMSNVRPGASLLFLRGPGKSPTVFDIPKWADPLFEKLPMPSATTNAEGQFTIHGAPAGALTLVVDGGDLRPQHRGPIPSSKGEKDVGDVTVTREEEMEGQVVDETGAPVPEAELRVGLLAGISSSNVAFLGKPIRAGANGAFTARGVSGNAVYVVARAPGVAEWTISPKIELAGDPVVVKVKAARSVLVRVRDASAKPVAAAVVAQRALKELSMFPPLAPAVATKAETVEPGAFRIRGLTAGDYHVVARAEGFSTASARVTVDESKEPEVTLTLEPERRIHVTVLGKEDGKPGPLEGASVFGGPKDIEGAGGLRALGSSRTGANGEATVRALGTGTYFLFASHPGYAITRISVELPAATTATIPMLVGGAVEGRVRRGAAPPEKPVMVYLSPRMRDLFDQPRITVTDAEGAFRFTHVVPGTYGVGAVPRLFDRSVTQVGSALAEADGDPFADLANDRVTVRDEETSAVDLQLDPTVGAAGRGTGAIHGVVTRNGAPFARVDVMANGNEWKMARTDDAGRYVLRGLKPGKYTVNVAVNRKGVQSSLGQRQVTVQAGEEPTVDFAIQTSSPIRGTVRSAVTGQPIEGAWVYAFASRPKARGGEGFEPGYFSARSDAEGAFEITDASAGTFQVQANALGHQGARVNDVVVTDASPPEPIAFSLNAGTVASGRVSTAGWEEATWAGLNFNAMPPGQGNGWCQIDMKEGTFKVDTLSPGRYWVMLNAAGAGGMAGVRFKTIEIDVPAGGTQSLDLKFEKDTSPPPSFAPAEEGK